MKIYPKCNKGLSLKGRYTVKRPKIKKKVRNGNFLNALKYFGIVDDKNINTQFQLFNIIKMMMGIFIDDLWKYYVYSEPNVCP